MPGGDTQPLQVSRPRSQTARCQRIAAVSRICMGSCFYFLSSGFEETNEALVEAGAPHLPGTLACTLIQQGSPELSRILNHLASHWPRI